MPFSIGAAILGGTSLIGGLLGANAASGAASSQAGAAQNATNAQLGMFNQVMGNLSPYMQQGVGALNSLDYQLGIGSGNSYGPAGNMGGGLAPAQSSGAAAAGATLPPQYANAGYTLQPNGMVQDQYGNSYPGSAFGVTTTAAQAARPTSGQQTSGMQAAASGNGTPGSAGWLMHPFGASDLNANLAPGFNFQLGQGEGQIANEGAATGMSGNTLAGLQSFGQNYAQNAYQQAFQNYTTNQQNIYGRLGNLAQLGEQASTGSASGAPLFSSGISQTIQGLGQAQAAGQVGVANALSGGIGNLGSAYAFQNLLSGGGGAGAAAVPWDAGLGAG
jgi:hypothetical protein